jgi:putative SOS response-associated peptidase YedK
LVRDTDVTDPEPMTTRPNPYSPNLSGITIGKPAVLAGLGVFLSYVVTALQAFGIPLTDVQAQAIQDVFNQAEIVLLPLVTYWWMKRHFHDTAVDLLHTEPPAPPVAVVEPTGPPPAS